MNEILYDYSHEEAASIASNVRKIKIASSLKKQHVHLG